jgi:MarR family transcriptional regulator, organic hydroperoxide resistance regulator
LISEFPSRYPSAEDSPGFQLWRASNLWQQQLRRTLREFDLTHVQFVLLAVTAHLTRQGAEATQSTIAQAAQTDEMMTSQVLRALAERKLLERNVSASDARARVVSVTETGKKLLAEAMPAVERADEAFFSVLGNDVTTLTRLAIRLTAPETGDQEQGTAANPPGTNVR